MNGFLSTLSALAVLLVGGYFTVRLRAFYLLHPLRTLHALPREGMRQMLLSLGGTVGVGNIVGVSVAIALGGRGAVFWMWVGALFSMALKYAEILLGMHTRGAGHGAAFYIKEALGTLAACLFVCLLLCDSVTMGGIIQANAIADAFAEAFGIAPAVTGVLVSIAAAAVFFLRVDLFALSTCIVPFMSLGYTAAALAVVFCRRAELPSLLCSIVRDAFAPYAAAGGVLGILTSPALRQGIVKGLFSSEAGCGTAPTAHAASKETVPARQGLFGVLEVFVDTVVMCTLTALAILLTVGEGGSYMEGFASVFGAAAPPVLAVFLFLFAFAAILAFGYYGVQALSYFHAGKRVQNGFLLAFCGSLFVGAVSAPAAVWEIADAVVCMMLLLNTSAVFVRREEIFAGHRAFFGHSHMGK